MLIFMESVVARLGLIIVNEARAANTSTAGTLKPEPQTPTPYLDALGNL